jgi:ABC-2 type transport system permease protein
MSGTVFDIGYRNYTGVREGRWRSFRAIFKDGVRTSLGFGRGGKAKILPWFFIIVLSMIGMIMALVIGGAKMLGGPNAANNLPTHSDYYGIASIVMFVFGAVVAPEVLCRDRRDRVINLYLVRPTTGADYIAARWTAFTLVMILAAWLPQIFLFLGLSAGDADPTSYIYNHWLDVPRFLLSGVVMAIYASTLAMLTASFTTRRAYASVFLVGLFVITTPFTVGLADELKDSVGKWISMFNLTNIPVHVNDIIFNDISEITKDAPARQLPRWMLVSWYFAWTLIPGTVLWARYRKLSP